MTNQLLRLPAVMHQVGLSKSTIYEWQREGRFPKAKRLSSRCVAWRASDIEAWINSRDGASDEPVH